MAHCFWCCINDPAPTSGYGACADCLRARSLRDSAAVTVAMRVANLRRSKTPFGDDLYLDAAVNVFESADSDWSARCSSKTFSTPAKPGEMPF